MLRIIAKDTTPPFGFRYVDPDTSFPFVADYLQQLVEKVRAHRQANKLAVPENLNVEEKLYMEDDEGVPNIM